MKEGEGMILDCRTHDLIRLQTERKKLEQEYVVIHSKIREVDFKIDNILDEQVKLGGCQH